MNGYPAISKNKRLRINKKKCILSVVYFSIFSIQFVFSQDIEPRRWNVFPLKTNVAGVGYAYTNGDILFDPLLKAENVTVNVNTVAANYVRSFKLFSKFARFDVLVPYTVANWQGLLSGNPTKVHRDGFADPRMRLSLNLLGAPAGTAKELYTYYATHPVNTTLGVSLAVTLPLGQYFDDKLINLGQNQFVFCPQIGLVHNWKKWSYELTGSVILFTKNPNFSNGKDKVQEPVFALQTHLIRSFKNKCWASVSLSYGLGGQSVVNRQPNRDKRSDIQSAASFGFPLSKRQGVKVVYVHSETLRDIGAKLNTVALGWSILF